MKKPLIILIAVVLLAAAVYLLIGRSAGKAGHDAQTTKETARATSAATARVAVAKPAAGHGAAGQAAVAASPASGTKASQHETRSSSAATAAAKATNTHAGPGAADVTLSIGGKQVTPGEPNILGVFPRQNMEIGASVPVRVVYPGAQPGDSIIAAVTDGGQLTGNKPVLPLTLDAGRAASFTFQGSREPGLFRVTLRRGLEVKTLEFWAGPEPRFVSVQQPPPPSRR